MQLIDKQLLIILLFAILKKDKKISRLLELILENKWETCFY